MEMMLVSKTERTPYARSLMSRRGESCMEMMIDIKDLKQTKLHLSCVLIAEVTEYDPYVLYLPFQSRNFVQKYLSRFYMTGLCAITMPIAWLKKVKMWFFCAANASLSCPLPG